MYEKLKDAGSMLWMNLDEQERQYLVYVLVLLATELVKMVGRARRARALQQENMRLSFETRAKDWEVRQTEHERQFAHTIAAEIRRELAGGDSHQ